MIPILLDYETLRFVWWMLLGVLLIGFSIMDGFDMGIALLNPIISRTDSERRVILSTISSVWEGNQVWLILGAGAIFAAFPAVYATAFSGFYIAMLLVLLSLILRPVSLEYRNKFPINRRQYWDYTLLASGIIPPLVFGVAFGNLFQGVPFFLDALLQPHYVPAEGLSGWFGGFIGLLNPFALLCGVVSMAMLTVQGGVFLAAKTRANLQARATRAIYTGLGIWLAAFIVGGVWVSHLEGYQVVQPLSHTGPSNPTLKQVVHLVGAWSTNYKAFPALYLVPTLGIFSCLLTALFTRLNYRTCAFITSSLLIASTITTAGVALFPMLLPSSFQPNHSLTVWDATSSHLTLWLMTIAALIFIPIVLFYTSWVFRVMRGPVTEESIGKHNDTHY
jgi:cytochrome bd ubiquinol oxidase subunit II